MPKSPPESIKSNGKLTTAVNPTEGTFILDDILSFEASGRAFVEGELVSWDGTSLAATPAGSLNNVVRGIGGTSAASHATTNSIYNSWIEEKIEQISEKVNDLLPNYDPFPDVRSLDDPTPGLINEVTQDLVRARAFEKLGIDRSDNNIHDNNEQKALDVLEGLRLNSLQMEPRGFSEVMTFGQLDSLLENEAPLTKRYLDPWTASIANVAIKFVPLNPDEMRNAAFPRRLRDSDFSSIIKGIIYFSDLLNTWVFRSLSNDVASGATIGYKFSENRDNWAQERHVNQSGHGNLIRG